MTSTQTAAAVSTSARFTDAEVSAIRRSFHDAGVVVLPGVLSPARVADLDTAYQELLASRPPDHVQATSGQRHVQMQLPLRPPFSDPDVVANPAVCQILEAELGAGFECSYYNSNTAYPGSTRQPVHRDAQPVFGQELGVPSPSTGIVLNIPLCSFTVQNGSTEYWPGTHLVVDRPGDEEVTLDDRVGVLASRRLDVAAGSVVLRDLRVWHRGMPNQSTNPRSMLAVVYKRSWVAFRHRNLRVPESTWAAWPESVRSVFVTTPHDPE